MNSTDVYVMIYKLHLREVHSYPVATNWIRIFTAKKRLLYIIVHCNKRALIGKLQSRTETAMLPQWYRY